MASNIQEKDIKRLREAGYLPKRSATVFRQWERSSLLREPHERVVFLPHFVRGLGFPLHQFVRGIMYYYGIDFHDLSPNSFLNISTFIVVCEAFLQISPHFGLRLKIFNAKPKVLSGEHAECGGAMVSRMPKIIWPMGAFHDSVKEWQQQWFYITEPRGKEWSAPPEFRSGAPLRITSWPKKGLNWSSYDELSLLQTHVQSVVDKDGKLVNILQVMLVRLVLPCQPRACNLWGYDPTEHQTLRELYDSSHKDIWKVLFKSRKSWPGSAEDRGYQLSHSASLVSYCYALVHPCFSWHVLRGTLLSCFTITPGTDKKVEWINNPAPLLEEPAGPLLTKMLVPAPYEVPKKDASKKVEKTRSGLRHRNASNAKSEDSSNHPSSEDE